MVLRLSRGGGVGNVKFELFAVTAPGLEAVCARELAALGMADVRPVGGGVEFTGELRDVYLANLWLRTASRVVVRLGGFRSRDFPELFRKASRLPWGRFIRPETRVMLRVASHRSRLQHTGRIAATVGEAIDRALGRPAPPADGPEQLVLVRFEDDACLISVDSSGTLLHRRGYREEAAQAPLRETLAAGLLLLLDWDGSVPLLDPMCGSGTLPIEAALLACNRPPGGQREFAFMTWPRYRPGLWQALLTEAARGGREGDIPIRGADRDSVVLAAARRNAERAGVQGKIDFSLGELGQTPAAGGIGLLLCNPPYGQRLGREEDLRPLFRALGEVCRSSLPGWRVAFLSPSGHLARATGLPLRPVAVLSNGGIAVTLWAT
jgi:putative N6-adenine-specific DNA methylase